MKGILLLAALVAVFWAGVSAGARVADGELNDYISFPFRSDLTASPAGDRIAWIEQRRGLRSIHMGDSPDFETRTLYTSSGDDGQELTGLTWSSDGDMLAWVRGGDHHRNGWAAAQALPNPQSLPFPAGMEIWVSDTRGGTARKAAEGDAPAFAPDGRVTFLRDGQLWSVGVAAGDVPRRLIQDRGRTSEFKWSPDGKYLAFVSTRGGYSFVGIYRGETMPISWLAPSSGIDGNLAWSPDGTAIAFARRTGEAGPPTLARRPRHFAIMIASIEGVATRRLWTSPDGPDGNYPIIPGDIQLTWGAAGRILFRAELGGWAHLYSLSVGGGKPIDLTPGAHMIEHITLSSDGRFAFYAANAGTTAGDIDRRHIFRVPVDRAAPVVLTSGEDLEWAPQPLGANVIAYLSATAARPPQVAVKMSDGRTRLLDDDREPYSPGPMTKPVSVSFIASDGMRVHGQLFAAPGKEKRPALVFVHGGPARQMLLGWSDMDAYAQMYALNQYLAHRGYIVLSVNYRLGIGYGRAFQQATETGAEGGAEYRDILAAAKYLSTQAQVDPNRIGIWGASYGGGLTALALARDSRLFKAGVALNGVYDWSAYPGRASVPPRYEQGEIEATVKGSFENSAMGSLSAWRSPVLLIHGDADGNVPFAQHVDLMRRLRLQNTPVEELVLPNEAHGFLRHDSWLASHMATARFLNLHLKP